LISFYIHIYVYIITVHEKFASHMKRETVHADGMDVKELPVRTWNYNPAGRRVREISR
jgi:hypothetical protein